MKARLSRADFDSYRPISDDPLAAGIPDLRLDDLRPTYRGKPKLSYLVSTWNRRAQLARSLECLARQEWRAFEVLLCDDGSTQDLSVLMDLFLPHLQLKVFRLERDNWHSCPSRAIHHMLPHARGEVVAIAHPEMMLHHSAVGCLYRGCTGKLDDAHYYVINDAKRTEGNWYYVNLKSWYLDHELYAKLDEVDWHTNLWNVADLRGFWACGGLGGFSNAHHQGQLEYPWWFVGAARRECPVWEHLPVFDGHASIDMWLMDYRRVRGIVDVVPLAPLCLHQPHLTSAVAPEDERFYDDAQLRAL